MTDKKKADPKASHKVIREKRFDLRARSTCSPSDPYESSTGLTKAESVVYPSPTVLKTPLLAVSRPVRHAAIISSIGFAPMGGSAANKRPARGICPPSSNGFELLPTRLKSGSIVSARSKAMHGTTLARPAQTQSPLQLQIINRALRDAALAPSANDALDCCAEALLHLAEIARAEVTHG
ncbi:hypothetical protein [Caballeronia sp. LZ035]|uniref:hypothetical protein n=1 Tax=Caballeronia sp. LZ035 TaxID=3038568 RepID=UPI00286B659D|nr:hypothetical protein [Caballeronia sp. LZ035]